MFKCKECGTEYIEKPDYCDCGNDTFEQIVPPSKNLAEDKPANEVLPKINIQPPKPQVFSEPKKDNNLSVTKVKSSADVVSLLLFIFSIILAFCTLFFFGNPKEVSKTSPESKKSVQNETVKIPTVDAYWDNSTDGIKVVQSEIDIAQRPIEQVMQPVQKEVIDPVAAKFEQWLNSPKKVVQENPVYTRPVQTQPQKQSAISQPIQQKVTSVQPAKSTAQKYVNPTANAKVNSPGAPNDLLTRVQNSIQFTNTNTQKTQQPPAVKTNVAQQVSKPVTNATTNTQKPATVSQQQPKTPQTQVTAKNTTPPTLRNVTTQPVKSQAELRQELASYKSLLRNNLGRKINFANVIGDGNCAITFKVDSSGKLTNRNFVTKSSNITLNDAVYNAMMSTPSYNPPPEGYKNETMTLRVKIYDGNYEITLN